MPVAPTYPGVYIQEIPSGVRTITGVATAITAFLGRAVRGPANNPTVVNNYGDYERIFGGLSLDSTMSYAVRQYFQNGGGQALVVRIVASDASSSTITLPGAAGNLVLVASSEGAWGDNLSAVVNHDTADPTDVNVFNLTVRYIVNGETIASETFLNLSVLATSPRYVVDVLKANSDLVRVDVDPITSNPLVGAAQPNAATTIATAGTGVDGSALVENDYTDPANEGTKSGLYALEKADLFNILCIPPFARDTDVAAGTWIAAQEYCQRRRAVLVVDAPSDWNSASDAVTNIDAFRAGWSNGDYAAIYFPRVRASDPLMENRLQDFAASGMVAGIYARTDSARGVWKAPAGQEATLSGARELAVKMTDAENGQLNPLGVNCLRSFPVIGNVVWGARTADGADRLASEWKYVPVRRLALYIEESLYRGTQWVVFEPNDEPLWSQIRLNVGSFMHDLFRQGAFQGSKPSDAYFVRCDSSTTTQSDINKGIVNILVGFAPLKPAEFVILSIQQMAGQIAT